MNRQMTIKHAGNKMGLYLMYKCNLTSFHTCIFKHSGHRIDNKTCQKYKSKCLSFYSNR